MRGKYKWLGKEMEEWEFVDELTQSLWPTGARKGRIRRRSRRGS